MFAFSLSLEPEPGTRKHHNKTIRGSFREAQTYPNTKTERTWRWTCAPCGCDQSESIPGLMSHDGSQSSAAAEKLQQIRKRCCRCTSVLQFALAPQGKSIAPKFLIACVLTYGVLRGLDVVSRVHIYRIRVCQVLSTRPSAHEMRYR